MEIKLTYVECKRCGHKWVARKTVITVCPKCKSPYWDKERQQKH
jgi:predicted Zn-ribbon and HTH transcriptional regulator